MTEDAGAGAVYVVMCGTTRVVLDQIDGERLALDVALAHDQVHHCSPWVQYPLEHVGDEQLDEW